MAHVCSRSQIDICLQLGCASGNDIVYPSCTQLQQACALSAPSVWLALLAMQPFFNDDWVRAWKRPDAPTGQGRGGLVPSEALTSKVAANDLVLTATVTDGNCGLHAFWLSAQHLFQRLRRQPWLSFKKLTLSAALARLRKLAADWLKENASKCLWAEFSIGDLIRSTSPAASLSDYLARMQKAGQWVDTSMLHALGCVFEVDIIVLQCGSDDALLGASLMPEMSDASDNRALISVALQNDFHFWACRPMEEVRCSEPVDQGDWVIMPDNAEEQEEGQCSELPCDNSLGQESIDAELALCKVLATWSPFASPNQGLVEALGVLAAATKGQRNSFTTAATATEARFCCVHCVGFLNSS